MCNGVVVVESDASLTCGQTTSAIGVKVLFQWPELEFFRQSNSLRETIVCTSGVSALPTNRQAASQALTPIVHLRQITSQYSLCYTWSPVKVATGDYTFGYIMVIPRYGWNNTSTYLPSWLSSRLPAPIEVLQTSYAGVRGETRARFIAMQ